MANFLNQSHEATQEEVIFRQELKGSLHKILQKARNIHTFSQQLCVLLRVYKTEE